jgi:enterobacteria phage integrase
MFPPITLIRWSATDACRSRDFLEHIVKLGTFGRLMLLLIGCRSMGPMLLMPHGTMSMPCKYPPHVDHIPDKRTGVHRLYFRRGHGPRTRLPDIKSPDFASAYASALTGNIGAKQLHLPRAKPYSIAALIESYLKSARYLNLRETTKSGYASRIETLRNAHGHRHVSGLTRERINVAILQPYARKPGAALSILKMLRVLIRHAIDIGWLRNDPSLGIRRPKIKRIRAWTDEEIQQFRDLWAPDTKQRLAFELFLNTGQRRSDVVKMVWSDIKSDGKKIVVKQQKTGRRLEIPLHSDLVTILEQTQLGHVSIITTAYNKPFTVDGFSQWMRNAIREAGLALACQPHGLRKAAGRRLAEAGCSANMIMAVLGHTTLAEAQRYTEEADQVRLAEAAMTQLEGHSANKSPKLF